MIIDQEFISISDLRDRTTKVVKDVQTDGKRIVMSKNKPIGIFLSIEEYNRMKKLNFEKEQATEEDIQAYKESSHGKDGVEAFSFLDSLK